MFKPGDICKTTLRNSNAHYLEGNNWAPDCIVKISWIEKDDQLDEQYGLLYRVILISGYDRWGHALPCGLDQYLYECNLILISHQPKAISGFAKFQKTIFNQQHNCFKEQSSDA